MRCGATARLLRDVPLPDDAATMHTNAVVLDTGSDTTRAGYSGDDHPRLILPTCVGTKPAPGDQTARHFGQQATKRRGEVAVSWPVERGGVADWGALEAFWEHLHRSCLQLTADSGCPVFITEPALSPAAHRTRLAEVFFEQLRVPSLFVCPTPPLGLYATGHVTGLVLDAGHGACHAAPVCEGFALYHAIGRLGFGGADVTELLRRRLSDKGTPLPAGHEAEACRYLKERACEVATDPRPPTKAEATPTEHLLPDGTRVVLGSERFDCCEALFDPAVLGTPGRGLSAMLLEAITKCDTDLRPTLARTVVLVGGTTLLRGLPDRVQRDLQDGIPSERVGVIAPKGRQHANWVGGSLLASLPTFQDFWVTRAEYAEDPNTIHRNCF
jgi:actin-related protein